MPTEALMPTEPNDRALTWKGRLDRFAPVRENGPGKPLTLIVLAVFSYPVTIAFVIWIDSMQQVLDASAIGFLPTLLVLCAAICLAVFLPVWVLFRAIMRRLDVTFVLDSQGVRVVQSRGQQAFDNLIGAAGAAAGASRGVHVPISGTDPWAFSWGAVTRVTLDAPRKEFVLGSGRRALRFTCTDAETWDNAIQHLCAHVAGAMPPGSCAAG
jgi:hypothetical protein